MYDMYRRLARKRRHIPEGQGLSGVQISRSKRTTKTQGGRICR